MNCPDTSEPIKLQNFVQQSVGDNLDQTYYFLVDTCENLAWLTGDKDCLDAESEEVKAAANNLLVQVKRMTRQFSSPNTYENNGREMVPFFNVERITLSSTISNYFEYAVVQRQNQYSKNPVYSDQLTTDLKFSTDMLIGYVMQATSSTSLPMSEFGPKFSEESENRIKRIASGA